MVVWSCKMTPLSADRVLACYHQSINVWSAQSCVMCGCTHQTVGQLYRGVKTIIKVLSARSYILQLYVVSGPSRLPGVLVREGCTPFL